MHPRDLQRFSGKQVVSRSRPVEAEDYVYPFKNKGNNCDDGTGRHGTNRVWSVYNVPRKKQGTKVT